MLDESEGGRQADFQRIDTTSLSPCTPSPSPAEKLPLKAWTGRYRVEAAVSSLLSRLPLCLKSLAGPPRANRDSTSLYESFSTRFKPTQSTVNLQSGNIRNHWLRYAIHISQRSPDIWRGAIWTFLTGRKSRAWT
jgi:hypothetical protein